MLKFYEYGIESVLKEIRDCLRNGLKSDVSKTEKDRQMALALGYVEALNFLTIIEEEEEFEEENE